MTRSVRWDCDSASTDTVVSLTSEYDVGNDQISQVGLRLLTCESLRAFGHARHVGNDQISQVGLRLLGIQTVVLAVAAATE